MNSLCNDRGHEKRTFVGELLRCMRAFVVQPSCDDGVGAMLPLYAFLSSPHFLLLYHRPSVRPSVRCPKSKKLSKQGSSKKRKKLGAERGSCSWRADGRAAVDSECEQPIPSSSSSILLQSPKIPKLCMHLSSSSSSVRLG